MTPEQEARLEEIRASLVQWGPDGKFQEAKDLLALVDQLREELERAEGIQATWNATALVQERDALLALVDSLREELAEAEKTAVRWGEQLGEKRAENERLRAALLRLMKSEEDWDCTHEGGCGGGNCAWCQARAALSTPQPERPCAKDDDCDHAQSCFDSEPESQEET